MGERNKKIYLARYGAFGDHIFCSPIPRALKEEGYNVTFEYNWKGAQIFELNPFIDKHVMFEPHGNKIPHTDVLARHRRIKKKYDYFINLSGSLEQSLTSSQNDPIYYYPKEWRVAAKCQTNYYVQCMKWCGLPEKYWNRTGEIYFTQEEHRAVRKYLESFKNKFVILWGLKGSMQQKNIVHWSKEVIDKFHKKHPNTFFIITTGPENKEVSWENDYVKSTIGKLPFRQVALMCRYVNGVVSAETGLGVVAGAYGVPKIQCLTTCSLKNIVGNDKNDFSLQSEVWCSPCTRAIYDTATCEIIGDYPICTYFDKEKVMMQLEKIYNLDYIPDWSISEEKVYM